MKTLSEQLKDLEAKISALVRDKPPGWQRECDTVTRIIEGLLRIHYDPISYRKGGKKYG